MSFLRATGPSPTSQGAELAEALRRVVGGEVRFDSYTRSLFSRDASMYTIEPIEYASLGTILQGDPQPCCS